LDADPRAFEKEKDFVGELIGVVISGSSEKPDEPIMLSLLVGFDHGAGRVAGIELDGRIRQRAAAFEFVRQHVFDEVDPGIDLLLRIIEILGEDAIEDFVAFVCELLDVGDDQVIFRSEMPVQCHLICKCSLCDRLDTDCVHTVPVEKFASREQNPFPRRLGSALPL